MKATVTTILYKSKILANGEHPIMLRVCYNGKRKYKSLKLSCSAKYWNEELGEVKSKHPYSVNMNSIINHELSNLKALVLDYERKGKPYSAQILVEEISKSLPTSKTLLELIHERIQYFKEEKGEYNTGTGYVTLYNLIKRFCHNRDYELFEIDKPWLKDFENFLRKTNKKDTSIYKHFCCLKATFNHAISKGYLSSDKNPFVGFEQHLDRRTKKRALSYGELYALLMYFRTKYSFDSLDSIKMNEYGIALPLESPPYDYDNDVDVRKYWNAYFKKKGTNKIHPTMNSECIALSLFFSSYFLQGLALVDLANLKWKDVKPYRRFDEKSYYENILLNAYNNEAEINKNSILYYEIELLRSKTSKPTRIIIDTNVFSTTIAPFLPRENEYNCENYIFGIYDNDCTDEKVKFGRMTYMTYLVNVNLKRVAKKIGLKDDITFYAARHTYASMLYHNGVPTNLIAQNMGRDMANIETYLKEFDTEKIIDANEYIWKLQDPSFPHIE
ncbi:MAG: site-specific integrase, partial [Tannerellaceae bacterium]|nr:site-specific integrase [Tannerellaceae bacterium]